MAAPYFLPHPGAFCASILGALLLIPQAIKLRAWNYLALNIVVMVGYTLSLYRIL